MLVKKEGKCIAVLILGIFVPTKTPGSKKNSGFQKLRVPF